VYLVITDAVSPAEVHVVWNEICKDSCELMWAEEILCYLEVISWQFPFYTVKGMDTVTKNACQSFYRVPLHNNIVTMWLI
jgi:hypothetical protein